MCQVYYILSCICLLIPGLKLETLFFRDFDFEIKYLQINHELKVSLREAPVLLVHLLVPFIGQIDQTHSLFSSGKWIRLDLCQRSTSKFGWNILFQDVQKGQIAIKLSSGYV